MLVAFLCKNGHRFKTGTTPDAKIYTKSILDLIAWAVCS